MNVPGSAADEKPSAVARDQQGETILALVKGEMVPLTRKEAYALASQLIIALEVGE